METLAFACLWFSMGFLGGVVYVIASVARHRARRAGAIRRQQAIRRPAHYKTPEELVEVRPLKPS